MAAGDLSRDAAWRIVAVAAAVPLVLALTQGALETAAVVGALAVGAAYSLPPVRLKRFPVVAALCISVVRAVAVNLGMYGHFSLAFGGSLAIPDSVWALTLFVLPFSFAIAVLKDVPDREGDRRFRIATFTVRLGPRRAFRLGLAALVARLRRDGVLGPLLVDDADGLVLASAMRWRSRCCSCGRGGPIRPTRRPSPASTCASGRCSSWSTRSSPPPCWPPERTIRPVRPAAICKRKLFLTW